MVSEPGMSPRSARHRSAQAWPIVGLAGTLLFAYLLIPFFLRGFRFPVGPDASVYLWWIGLVRHDGLSAVGNRAGVPAVALVLSEGLGMSPVTLLAGSQCAVGTTVGLAASGLVRDRSDTSRRVALLAGFLTGVFAVYVAAGYFSTLAFAALFLGAAAFLALGTTRSALLAGAMLGAAGVTHPEIAVLGALILAVTAVLALRSGDRHEALRVGGAAAGGVALSGIAGVALLAGPAPLAADTSRDLFLIRAGLSDLLRKLYVHRIFLHVWGYVPYALVPLGVVGIAGVEGFLRRLLLAWGAVTLAVITVGSLTGWFPPERALSVAFAFPILAAFGIERLLAHRSRLATVAAALGFVAIVAAAGWTWWRAAPPVYEVEAVRATEAARFAASVPPGTPLVFQVTGDEPVLTFFATRAANEFRAAVPPERIRDIYVVVSPPPPGADAERSALWSIYEADVAAAAERSGRTPLVFRLTAFIRGSFPEPEGGLPPEVSPGVRLLGDPPTPQAPVPALLAPSTPVKIAASAAVLLVLLTLVGSGWARAVARGDPRALPLSPAAGLAALTLAAIALERAGLAIERPSGALTVLVVASVPGWIVARLRPVDA